MKKIIILGSNSFAGSCYVDYLLDKGYIIYGLSRSKEPSKILLKYKKNKNLKNFRFYKFDINKNLNILINILKKNKIEYVVDFLGQGMVAESWKNPAPQVLARYPFQYAWGGTNRDGLSQGQ